MIKAVIFDMDGVLFDTEALASHTSRMVGQEFGINISDAVLQKSMSASPDAYRALMLGEFGPHFDVDAFLQRHHALFFRELDENGIPVKVGAPEALAYLKTHGYPMAVASSSLYDRVISNLTRTGFIDYFDVILGGDKVAHSKPAPDIYQTAAAQLGLPCAKCLAVEDSGNGIQSAFSAGCPTVMIPDQTPPDVALRAKTVAVLDSLLALPAYMESLI